MWQYKSQDKKMSNTFTFDTKLNNYSSIGLGLSGGIDSALLLYYLLRSDYKVKCYTLIDKGNNNNTEAAKFIKTYIEESVEKNVIAESDIFYGKVISHEFITYKKDTKKGKRNKLTEIWTNLFESKKIDCLVLGSTQYLKNIEDIKADADTSKPTEKWINDLFYRPFLDYDKSWIKTGCDACGLTDKLPSISVSCVAVGAVVPCKECLWCKEKYEVFKCY